MIKFGMIATWNMAFDAICEQYNFLKQGDSINEHLVDAVCIVEDYPFYKSVGFGGLPNIDGIVQLDAAFMDGDTLEIGAVAAIENIKNPIKVAYSLRKNKFNSLLVGNGATQYALNHNFKTKNMLSERAEIMWKNRLEELKDKELKAYDGHDTVCILGLDQHGKLSSATSTSGLFMKEPGRVGDSPISGSGFYANSDAGACAATGVGEIICKTCISYEVVRLMEFGYDAQEACEIAMKKTTELLERKYGEILDISIVAMDKNANPGAATTLKEFSYVYFNHKQEPIVKLVTNENKHFDASKEWLDEYHKTRHKQIVLKKDFDS